MSVDWKTLVCIVLSQDFIHICCRPTTCCFEDNLFSNDLSQAFATLGLKGFEEYPSCWIGGSICDQEYARPEVVFSRDGLYAATVTRNGLHIWSTKTGEKKHTLVAKPIQDTEQLYIASAPNEFSSIRDGLLVANQQGLLSLYSFSSGELLKTTTFSFQITSLA